MPRACIDGNEAAARVAHALSEVVALYPITPASPMGEHADDWSAAGRRNLWGSVPEVIQLQSEAGAAGTLHGALQAGALATTFTSSQGLLLMLPNMYKIAGELTAAVIHVAARAIATHALSIFGDHSDVMAARSTGWAMLAAASPQEAHDLALVAHATTLRARIPFLHFFDGFRTSHEMGDVELLTDADLRALVREDDVLAHRLRGLSPERPVLRGTAQNPDVFFASREAANTWYDAVPRLTQDAMDELAARTGRHYSVVDYVGAPDAERVLVLMGSAAGAAMETIEELNRRGEKVGLLVVRLFRPLPVEQLVAALPATVRRLAVLDRVKEPGAPGEPLYLDVVAALAEHGRIGPTGIDVIGARYGLASKELNPPMLAGLFAELALDRPRRHVTVGIRDDVTFLSVDPDPTFTVPRTGVQAVFFGLGSDGTVSANKAAVSIIGEKAGLHAQGYFVYDSKKAGSVTVSHLRFGTEPIRSTYLVTDADFVACHQFDLLSRMPVLDVARPGATVLLDTPWEPEEVWDHLPIEVQQQVLDRDLNLWTVPAHRVARSVGLGGRINTVMQPCFFHLSGVLPAERAVPALEDWVRESYGRRGVTVVERNLAAIRQAVDELRPVPVPSRVTGTVHRMPPLPAQAPQFVRDVTARLLAGEGDMLPVSALPAGGTFPTATARWEKRGLAQEIPVWDPSICIDCGKCAIVCPHAAIRTVVLDPAQLDGAPSSVKTKPYGGKDLSGMLLTVQVAPDDCTGCGICVDVCPARSKEDASHKSIDLLPAVEHRDAERVRWDWVVGLPEIDRSHVRADTVKGSQLLPALFEFSGACSGCGETPYLKLLSQLFGDRMVVANATGCSSIYGANLPTTPWAVDQQWRGPAWSNSLFEDNAEFGLGLLLGHEKQAGDARALLAELSTQLGHDLTSDLLEAAQEDAAGVAAQRVRVRDLLTALGAPGGPLSGGPRAARLASLAEHLIRRSTWLVGGDGWAYDIGFGGLDHVLSTGRDVNILVLDTEVYSNTGGQASKATPRGAVAKFAASGKRSAKKDLGAIARAYGNVYVAQIAMGANEMQTVRALREADAWPGPSLVIAYSTCVAHGIEMSTSMTHQKDAVASGYWPIYRYHPGEGERERPLRLDSKAPSKPLRDFVLQETRFAALARSDPERARALLDLAQSDVDERWRYYAQLAGIERTIPHPPLEEQP